MRTIVVGDEKNLAALRKRLLDPGVTGAVRKGVDEELRAANPHLDLDKLSPGAVVVVPDVPGVAAAVDDQATATGTVLPGDLGEVLAGTGADRSGGLGATRTLDLGAARLELARQLSSAQLTKAVKGDDQLRAEVSRIGDALAEEQRRSEQWKADLAAAVPAWQAGLDGLRDRS
jgi:hypothetical protein